MAEPVEDTSRCPRCGSTDPAEWNFPCDDFYNYDRTFHGPVHPSYDNWIDPRRPVAEPVEDTAERCPTCNSNGPRPIRAVSPFSDRMCNDPWHRVAEPVFVCPICGNTGRAAMDCPTIHQDEAALRQRIANTALGPGAEVDYEPDEEVEDIDALAAQSVGNPVPMVDALEARDRELHALRSALVALRDAGDAMANAESLTELAAAQHEWRRLRARQ